MSFMNRLKKKSVRLITCVTVALAICASMYSCRSEKYSVSTLSGTFEEFWIYYFRVSLNPDGTFEWHYIFNIADLTSDGNWWIEGKYVVLNSFIQNKDCFPVDVQRVDVLPKSDDVIILCDKMAYQKCLMCFFKGGDSIAIDSDTIRLDGKIFPDTINICIKANKKSGVLSKSDNIIIKEPGIYRIETKGIYLRERPLNYQVLKQEKFKILSKDSIQDIFGTNITLNRNSSEKKHDGGKGLARSLCQPSNRQIATTD